VFCYLNNRGYICIRHKLNQADAVFLYHSKHEGRERAREEHGDDADEGHDGRIEKLKDMAQTTRNRIAWCKGKYAYENDSQGGEDEQEEGDDNGETSDMGIESNTDSD